MHDELGGVNPADRVGRCAGTWCDKSFQGSLPAGWERLRPDAGRRLAHALRLQSATRCSAQSTPKSLMSARKADSHILRHKAAGSVYSNRDAHYFCAYSG